jgi:hypothetical protein
VCIAAACEKTQLLNIFNSDYKGISDDKIDIAVTKLNPAARLVRNRQLTFKFKKCRQLFIIAMRISNEDGSPLQSTPERQPQLQPALLRLSAMIPQYFNDRDRHHCCIGST